MDIWKNLEYLIKDTKSFILEIFTLNIHLKRTINSNKSKYLSHIHDTLISVFYNDIILKFDTTNNMFICSDDDIHTSNSLQTLNNLNEIDGLSIDFTS